MRSFSCLVCLVVSLSSLTLRAEDKPDPRENLDTAIPEAIRLLEKKDYEGLLKSFVAPKDFERITAEKTLAVFAKSFAEEKAEVLLQSLSAVKGMTPTLSEDEALATFMFKEPIDGRNKIQFQKIDKYWYIKN